MDIGNYPESTLRQFSREELHAIMREANQAAKDAKQGSPKAVDRLLSIVWTLVQRQRAIQIKSKIGGKASQRKQVEKAGKPPPNRLAIIKKAAYELQESDFNWPDMIKAMRSEQYLHPDRYNVRDPRTMESFLNANRVTTEVFAREFKASELVEKSLADLLELDD